MTGLAAVMPNRLVASSLVAKAAMAPKALQILNVRLETFNYK